MHYINTPKQLILNFYDNFNVKIVIVLLLYFLAQKQIVGTPIIYFGANKKRGKGCFSLSETQFYYIKVRNEVVKITRACFHEKAVLTNIAITFN